MELKGLRDRAVKATIWSGLDLLTRQGLRFIVTMILARLLTPSDFGVIGMLAIFIGLSLAIVESGFPKALIQRTDVSEIDLSSVFFFNILVGLLCAVLLCFIAPRIAAFFDIPILKPLTWLVAANLLIGSFGSVQNALLVKKLDFQKILVISMASTVISGIVALVLAWQQFGVWSLAIQIVVATTINTFLLWALSAWRPRLMFSMQSIRSLFKYSSFILLTVLADVLYTRLHTIVIGKWYSAADLGYYTRADQTQQLPGGVISGIISRVTFPIFSAVQEDKMALKSGLRKAITTTMFINFPIMLGLVVTAKSLVPLLFGSQWGPSVPYLQILSIAGVLLPFEILNMNVLAAQGHSGLLFRITLIKKAIGITFIGIACFYSITMIAWSFVATGLISFFINSHYTGTLLDYGAFKQLRDTLPYLVGSIVMVVFTSLVALVPVNAPITLVGIQVVIGMIVYAIYCHLFRLAAFVDMVNIASSYIDQCVKTTREKI